MRVLSAPGIVSTWYCLFKALAISVRVLCCLTVPSIPSIAVRLLLCLPVSSLGDEERICCLLLHNTLL